MRAIRLQFVPAAIGCSILCKSKTSQSLSIFPKCLTWRKAPLHQAFISVFDLLGIALFEFDSAKANSVLGKSIAPDFNFDAVGNPFDLAFFTFGLTTP